MGDVVTDAGERMDHRFHFIEHAVDDDRELRERLVDRSMRKPLAQISGDDALDPLVDLLDPFLRAHAQPCAGQQAEQNAGSRPSASACPTTREISLASSTLRPITSTSPFGIRRAIARTV